MSLSPDRATHIAIIGMAGRFPGARNLVIEKAAHEIVSFIDDDCISEPEWLAAIEVGFLRAENIGIVGGLITHQPASRPSAVDTYYRLFHHFES